MADEAQSVPPIKEGQETFTAEQEALLERVRDEWLAVGISKEVYDRPKARETIGAAYEIVGLPAPQHTLFTPSPLAGALSYGLVAGGALSEGVLRPVIEVPTNTELIVSPDLDLAFEAGRATVVQKLAGMVDDVSFLDDVNFASAVNLGALAAATSRQFDTLARVAGPAPTPYASHTVVGGNNDLTPYLTDLYRFLRSQASADAFGVEEFDGVSPAFAAVRDTTAEEVTGLFDGKRRIGPFIAAADMAATANFDGWTARAFERAGSWGIPQPVGETIKKSAAATAAESLSMLTYSLAHKVTDVIEDPVDRETFHSFGQAIQNNLANTINQPFPSNAVRNSLQDANKPVSVGKKAFGIAADNLASDEFKAAMIAGIEIGISNAVRNYLLNWAKFTPNVMPNTIIESCLDKVENWWKNALGRYEAGWLGFFLACGEMGCDTSAVKPLAEVTKHVGQWWPTETTAIMCDRPRVISRDKDFRLHRNGGAAVAFDDGYGVYAWHGTTVPGDMVEEGWDIRRIFNESNTEVRRCAIERMGWGEFIKESKMTPASESVPDPGNAPFTIQLWDLPSELRDMYEQRARILLCTNGSPERDGTRHQFGLVVPATHNDPVAAAADTFGWPVEAYKSLEVRR